MKRSGLAELPLHGGKAPQWLVRRMIGLSKEIVTIVVDEYGQDVFLQRISDPYWFQAFGCVLGYDWHSSGVTTVVTGVLKSALRRANLGLAVCGGKGKASMQTLSEIEEESQKLGLSSLQIDQMRYASRMTAKVDNTAIQAGYPLYHHAFVIDEKGKWAVIQQGMSTRDRTARRYHWRSNNLRSFTVEPHEAIVGNIKRERALDMTSSESEECRKISVDIIKEKPEKTVKMLKSIRPSFQKSLREWMTISERNISSDWTADYLSMPSSINWKTLRKAYEFQPRNYEELLSIRGIGPSTVRGIALVSELIYGEKPSWKDPVKYSFAYGGKDGVPFPVDRKAMDESIALLKQSIENARVGDKERLRAIQRLRAFVPPDMKL